MFHEYRFDPHTCIDRGIWHSLTFEDLLKNCTSSNPTGEKKKSCRRKAQGEEKGDDDDEGSERKGKN